MRSLFIAILVGIAGAAHAQDGLMKQARDAGTQAGAGLIAPTATVNTLSAPGNTITARSPAMAGNNGINTNAVMAKLAKALKLTDAQKKNVGDAVDAYLNKKAQLAPMAATDEAGYNHQGANAYTGFMSKVKATLSKSQYTSFLKLKPKASDKTNVLNAIFK